MSHSTPLRLARQIDSLRTTFGQASGLPFASLLSAEDLHVAFGPLSDEPLYSPIVTLSMFLSQVFDADHSCCQAVARLLAQRTLNGEPPCGAGTGGYCKARLRLGENALHQQVVQTGRTLHQRALPSWLWQGRPTKIIDGTTVTMPDTPANQAAYPQPDGQQPGLGFPMARLGVLLCLATGAVLDVAIAPYRGKGTGELSLLRQLWQHLDSGDILLGDRIYCSYFEIALLRQRGIDVVLHKHQSRRTDFRTGKRLGSFDHVVVWKKPKRPDWMNEGTYQALPETMEMREVAIRVKGRGGRRQRIVVVTTLLDPAAVGRETLGEGYQQRWHGEVDVRSIKEAMQMGQLRCKSPAMVCKEIWVHLLAYNLIRGVMAQAAARHERKPREISFTGAMQTLNAFQFGLQREKGAGATEVWERLLAAIASHRVGHRPGRVEPRAKKRRKKNYPQLTEPRKKAQKRLLGKAA